MKSFLFIAVVFLAAFNSSAKEPAFIRRLDGTSITTAEAESFAKQTLEDLHVTGAQIVVVNKGKIVWSSAFGHRRLDPKLPMGRETTTWAASITKSVFATYLMQLVERGEFDLDKPVVAQLAQPLNSYETYRDSASEIVNDPAWSTVTPRMLMAHASGLANFAFIEPDKKMHLHFKPGTQFRYSGEGINLVQFIIEQQKRQPLDQLMQEALFSPLKMTRTGIIYRQDFADNVADRYDLNEKFRSQTKRFPARAAGSMTTSAEDLGSFVCALFAGKVIKPKTQKAMLEPFILMRSLHQFPLHADEPEGTEGPAVGLGYGVGWGVLTKTKFGPAFFKEGHGDGAQNYMICFPRSQTCMIVLSNSDNAELAFRSLFEKILGNTVTPWEWEGYTHEYIQRSRQKQ